MFLEVVVFRAHPLLLTLVPLPPVRLLFVPGFQEQSTHVATLEMVKT